MKHKIHGMRNEKASALMTAVILLLAGCSPSAVDDQAPPHLELQPESLALGPDEDTELLMVANTGGKQFSFTVTVSATAGGVDWLSVEPASGAVDAGGTQTLLVRVVNRDLLVPSTYQGQVTIEPAGLAAGNVNVTMTVGQPVLLVEPSERLDFGGEASLKTLIVKNSGAGLLSYVVKLPGTWLTTEAVLQKEIRPNEPQALSLEVDRSLVPWYGDGKDEIVVTSNGLDDATHSGTAKVEVAVFVDPACDESHPCSKGAWYCDMASDAGKCVQKAEDGQSCGKNVECKSGYCVEGTCCATECPGECQTCSMPGSAGTCTQVKDGTTCDDGQFCTVGDQCTDGGCESGSARDCSQYDSACSEGQCDEEADSCVAATTDDKCVIDGECHDVGEWHPDVPCLRCLPEQSNTGWSLIDGACFIDDQCYALGEPVEGECLICNPAVPHQPFMAPDGTDCDPDTDPCTKDLCEGGECQHLPVTTGPCDDENPCTKDDQCVAGKCNGDFYSCDDGLEGTEDVCNGDGTCAHAAKDGYCFIDGNCHGGNDVKPGSFGCSACKPATSKEEWTTVADGLACDDGQPCTLLDHCEGGECVGAAKDCDDSLTCTVDACQVDFGDCANILAADWCLIDGKCVPVDTSPAGKDAQCRICDPYGQPLEWTPYHEGLPCDDGSECTQDSICSAGECVAVGPICDDGNVCTEDACNDQKMCEHSSVKDGTACPPDDIDCTDDVCLAGQCEHPVSTGKCLVEGACHANNDVAPGAPCLVCKASVSQDAWTSGNEGLACDDGLFCTVDDKCEAGACMGDKRDCGGDQCNEAWCIEEQDKCVAVPLPDAPPCEDSDPCTLADECLDGACVGTPKDCSYLAEGKPCIEGYCELATGECKSKPVPEGGPCDDGLFCTTGEKCQDGECLGTPLVCEAAECQVGSCNEEFDQCVYSPDVELVGSPCDDGLTCTSGSMCDEAGTCTGGQAKSSQECSQELGNKTPCMTGLCTEPDGCVLAPVADQTSCSLPSASSAECQSGTCEVVSCKFGFGNCNGDHADGCEVNVAADPMHCGGCGQPCQKGSKFANAEVACTQGECEFVACFNGFEDANGNCANSGPCSDGCEANECVPLADGTIEIPDDGEDNDCDGFDSVNDESRGYYIDKNFPFGGDCPAPGKGTRACPFDHILWALYEAQEVQDWSEPELARREIYIAAGEYVEQGNFVELSKPLWLLGGYLRTVVGPWTRDADTYQSVLRSTGGNVLNMKLTTDKWLLVDRILMSGGIHEDGSHIHVLLSFVGHPIDGAIHVTSTGWYPAFHIRHSVISGGLEAHHCAGWLIVNSRIDGKIDCIDFEGATFLGNLIYGHVEVGTTTNCYTSGSMVFSRNIVYSKFMNSPDYSQIAFTCNANSFVGNVFVAPAACPTSKCYALRNYYDSGVGERAIRSNAFVGYAGEKWALFRNNGGTVANPLVLNMSVELAACGKGGNIAIDNIKDAGFLSLDPESPDFLKPGPGSPLIDAGLDLPYTCEGVTIEAPATDLSGQEIPCGEGYDMGCYEYCEEE